MTAILFEYFHGAVTRVGATETAVPHREESFNVLIPAEWVDPADTQANIDWTQETFALLEPYRAGRRWLNYLDDDDALDAVRAAYGPNYDRLAQIKGQYDPGGRRDVGIRVGVPADPPAALRRLGQQHPCALTQARIASGRRDDVRELLDDAELLVAVEHSDGGEHLDADVVALSCDVRDRGFVHVVNERGGVLCEQRQVGNLLPNA
jgi:hypothetical protein